jgi:hypothetical protein
MMDQAFSQALFQAFLPAFSIASPGSNPNTDRLFPAFIQSFVQIKKNQDDVPTVRIPILRYTYICSRFPPVQIPTSLPQVRT